MLRPSRSAVRLMGSSPNYQGIPQVRELPLHTFYRLQQSMTRPESEAKPKLEALCYISF